MAPAQPAYRVIADEVRQRVHAGDYAIGDELPRIDALAERHAVSHMTVKRALEVLVAEGIIQTRQGKRAVVVRKPTSDQLSVQDQLTELRDRLAQLDARTRRLESHVIE